MRVSDRVASALCGMWEARTRALGGTVEESDGLVTYLTGIEDAAFNPTLVRRTPGDAVSALASAERLYEAIGLPFGIDLDTSIHAEVRDAADAAGLRVTLTRPGMIAHPSEVPDVAPADGVAIVDARSRLDDVAAVASAGFDADRALTRRFVADAVFADRGARVYLATLDGRGVSTVETALQDGVLGVFGVATVPAARRRGIAGAITAFAVRDRAEDADLAFLQSSEMGRGVYERIGFRDVSTWEVWARA